MAKKKNKNGNAGKAQGTYVKVPKKVTGSGTRIASPAFAKLKGKGK